MNEETCRQYNDIKMASALLDKEKENRRKMMKKTLNKLKIGFSH